MAPPAALIVTSSQALFLAPYKAAPQDKHKATIRARFNIWGIICAKDVGKRRKVDRERGF